jgi:hypothetical protein
MAEPIAIITSLYKVAEGLVTKIKDRQGAAEAKNVLFMVGQLQAEFFELQSRILKLETENAELKQKSLFLQSPKPKQEQNNPNLTQDLDDVSVKMLAALANAPNGIKKENLFAHFGLSLGKGDLLFQRLIKKKLVDTMSVNMLTGVTWTASDEGRECLDKLGLL